jgi:DNA polymerase-1
MHNAQFDIRIFKWTVGITFTCWWDTQIASCLIDENESHRLKDLHSKYVSKVKEQTFAEYFKNIKFQLVPVELAYPYAANDAIDTWEMYEYQYNQQGLNEQSDLWWLYTNIEIPMIDVIVALEDNGVYVDKQQLDDFKVEYHEKLDTALIECYDEIAKIQGKIDTYLLAHPECKLKQPINIGSQSQLAILFYDILGVAPFKDKKPRAMDEDIMDELKDKFPLASKIIDYRKAQKITGTYIDNIYNIIHTDGRVHTGFNSNGAVTGRMSSKEPLNLQNIPARGPGKKLRRMFAGQTTEREVELRSDNAYILNREEEIQLQDGTWVWVESVKPGDILESGEVVKDVIVKEFKVLIGIKE